MSLYCIDEFKELNKRLDKIEKKLDDVIYDDDKSVFTYTNIPADCITKIDMI